MISNVTQFKWWKQVHKMSQWAFCCCCFPRSLRYTMLMLFSCFREAHLSSVENQSQLSSQLKTKTSRRSFNSMEIFCESMESLSLKSSDFILKLYVIIYSKSRSRSFVVEGKAANPNNERAKKNGAEKKIIPSCVWWIYMILKFHLCSSSCCLLLLLIVSNLLNIWWCCAMDWEWKITKKHLKRELKRVQTT